MNQPIWRPDPNRASQSQLARFARRASGIAGHPLDDYAALHRWSVSDPAAFWGELWRFADVRIVLFVAMQPGQRLDDALRENIRRSVLEHASPRHVPAHVVEVPDIPLSGKNQMERPSSASPKHHV